MTILPRKQKERHLLSCLVSSSIHQCESSHNRVGAKLQLAHLCTMTHLSIANAGIHKDSCARHRGRVRWLLQLAQW